jgi:LmbE family N-acetylglucosaminyl deacetylase
MANVLVIAPHPDDEVLGCGGTIARHADAGDTVHVVVVTRGTPDVFSTESVKVVWEELRRAQRVLGVADCRHLDFPALKMGQIAAHVIADRLREIVLEIRPDTVYVPHPGDIHGDHKAVFWAACVATRPTPEFQVSRLMSYETLSETEWGPPSAGLPFVPNIFIDITAQLERKLKAASMYASQIKKFPHPRSCRCLRALAQYRGATACMRGAEAFVLLREVAK